MEIFEYIPSVIFLFWGTVAILLVVMVHVMFAFGVYSDALRLRRNFNTTIFVNPAIWLFATIIGGVLVAAVYWLLHHSTLNPSRRITSKETDQDPML